VTVADDGPGIDSADQARVFDRFVQLGSQLTGKPHGMGLGLSIAAAITRDHGGAIWVESAPGAGATFAASFPTPSAAALPVAPQVS